MAISTPIFTSQLEKSRDAVTLSNIRAAKAAAIAAYLDAVSTGDATYYYDASSGAVKSKRNNITGYGKGTTHEGSASNTQDGYNPKEDYVGKVVKVQITETTAASGSTAEKDQGITVSWEK